ncbi:TrwH protein [Bartonella kosoyi]|uniref:TrwH protein n=1 Tax=Bartonella kosoyi TaxID=2133959 RepID=A0A5B9CUA4_9HYPH|nr:TrwH protein [Bartonella kosoyi]
MLGFLIVKKRSVKVKSVVFIILIANLLSACALAPKLKQPNDRNRVPINKTIPAEIKRGDR